MEHQLGAVSAEVSAIWGLLALISDTARKAQVCLAVLLNQC
jgi:hypothetical protein